MPCALCGDIIPTQVTRCPACGAWARRRDFRALGIAVFMLLAFNAFIGLGSGINLARLTRTLETTTTDSYNAAATGQALSPYSEVFMTSAMLAMITGLLYLMWFWLAHRQASQPQRYSRGWVIGSWLCPVVNLWLPPRIVHDVWVSSGRYQAAERHGIGAIVTAWWISLLSAVGLLGIFPDLGIETLAQARFAAYFGIAAMAAQALAAILCMMIVFRITRLQVDRPAT